MDKKRLERLEHFEKVYINAIGVCDPIDYIVKQRNLLYALSKFILAELDDHKEKKKKIAKNAKRDERVVEINY